jgi:hypothetical protein
MYLTDFVSKKSSWAGQFGVALTNLKRKRLLLWNRGLSGKSSP